MRVEAPAETWVLLRGLFRQAGHWGEFPRQLQSGVPRARVVAIDLPGVGASPVASVPVGIDAMADAVREQVRGTCSGPIHLVALSLGAMVALSWACRFPRELAGVVVINPSAGGLSPWHERLRPGALADVLKLALAGDLEKREAGILALTSNRPDRSAAVLEERVRVSRERPLRRRVALRQLVAAAGFRLPATAPEVPLLVLVGEGDRLVSPRCGKRLAAAWNVALASHPTAGHDLPLDEPEWVIAKLLERQKNPDKLS